MASAIGWTVKSFRTNFCCSWSLKRQQKQYKQEEQNNQASADENREVDEEMKSTLIPDNEISHMKNITAVIILLYLCVKLIKSSKISVNRNV